MLNSRLLRVRSALIRQCMAEFLGTFVLLLFGLSAAAQVKTSRETKGQTLSIHLSWAMGVMSATYLTKGISGAHLNPAVSLSFCILGKLRWGQLLPYCVSQIFGAYVGAALVYLLYYDAIMEFSGGVLTVYGPNETASIFATYPSEYLPLGGGFLDQVVGTGTLLLCLLSLTEKRNTPAPPDLIAPIVAGIVLGIIMSMSANCGAALNPARDLGPRLLTLTAGWGTEVFTCYNYWFWVPIVAPIIGALTGTSLYLIFIEWQLPDEPQESHPKICSVGASSRPSLCGKKERNQRGSGGCWCLSPANVPGERRGSPWTGRQSVAGQHRDRQDKQPCTHTPRNSHVFGL